MVKFPDVLESGVLPKPTEGTQRSAGNLTAALPRRPVTCDEGRSHDRNSFFAACFHLTDAVRLQWRQTLEYDYRHSQSCTLLDTGLS